MLNILLAIVIAAVAWWLCIALGLPSVVALIAAVIVLVGAATSLPDRRL